MLLFENQTANGTSLVFPSADSTHNGGPVFLAIGGDMDGASIAIEVNQDNIGFVLLQGQTQTTIDVNEIFLASGHQLRLVLSNAGASTDITASVV